MPGSKKRSFQKTKEKKKESVDSATPRPQRTLESLPRESDVVVPDLTDAQVEFNYNNDEFSSYFAHKTQPKIIVTTTKKASQATKAFAQELSNIFFNSEYIARKPKFELEKIINEVKENSSYTDIILIGERLKEPHSLSLMHLPNGPTAFFKLSSIRGSQSLQNHGACTSHPPELILNNFNSMLGISLGRFLMSLFPSVPDFIGRQVVTFHNQRDYVFFRRHRYIFENDSKARLQELGPRFTLKLLFLKKGLPSSTASPDQADNSYIWIRKKNMNKRTSFHI